MYTRFIDLFYSLYKFYTTPHHLQHTTDTMDQTKVHAHTQDQPCPHKSHETGKRNFWTYPRYTIHSQDIKF